jgi:glycosyltransferase involved in cell wall biosynthesis
VQPGSFWWKVLKSSWRTFHISKLIKKHDLDIYHGLSHELPAGIEESGIKSVVTIHDLIYLRYPEFFKSIDRGIYDRKFRYSCKVANRIHAISEQTKRDLMHYFQVPEEKIEVIYQSINPLFFQESTRAQQYNIRRKYQLPEKFILTVGTVEPRKNLLSLLEGMVQSKTYIPLVVVGKLTDYQQKIQKFIEADLNRLQIFFLSRIQDDELYVLYQMAEIMVYPSLFEGFGLPVAEANASGCPVITSNTSSLPEAGGSAALYINPENPEEIGNTIKTLLADQSLRDSLIERGRVNAQRFTGENFAKQLKHLYNTVLND